MDLNVAIISEWERPIGFTFLKMRRRRRRQHARNAAEGVVTDADAGMGMEHHHPCRSPRRVIAPTTMIMVITTLLAMLIDGAVAETTTTTAGRMDAPRRFFGVGGGALAPPRSNPRAAFAVPRGGSERGAAGVSSSAPASDEAAEATTTPEAEGEGGEKKNDEEEETLNAKVFRAMRKLGIATGSGLGAPEGLDGDAAAGEEDEIATAAAVAEAPRCDEDGVCTPPPPELPEYGEGAVEAESVSEAEAEAEAEAEEEVEEEAVTAERADALLTDEEIDEAADSISSDLGVSKSVALASLAAAGGDAAVARDIVMYEREVTGSVPDDCDEVRRLVGVEGWDEHLARRALALADMNVDDARAILEAEAADEEAEEAERERAEREAKEAEEAAAAAEAEEKARAEERMTKVTVPAGFDPAAVGGGGVAASGVAPQQQPQQPGMPKEARKEDVVFDVTAETMQRIVIESPVPVLLDVYADWCGPCKALTPALEQMAMKSGGAFRVAKLNTDEEKSLSSQVLGVTALPTVFGLRDGRIRNSFQGMPQEEGLKSFLMSLLMGTDPTNPPLSDSDRARYDELSTKLAKFAGAAAFPFATREKMQDRISARLDDLVTERGGDMGRADESAKVLRSLISNVVRDPAEMKYRSINLEHPVIRAKVGSFPSCLSILRTVGFVPTDGGRRLLMGQGKKIVNVAPLAIGRDTIDKWADRNRHNIAAAARKRRDEVARAELAREEAERRAAAEEEETEEEEDDEDVEDANACSVKMRLEGKKKVHELSFDADEPLSAVLAEVANIVGSDELREDGQNVQITCAARRLVVKASNADDMEKTFRDHGLAPFASIVVKVGDATNSKDDGGDGGSNLSKRAASKKKKRGSHTMQSVGIYSKDDNAKGELIDGGGGTWYEHDVSDTEDEKDETASPDEYEGESEEDESEVEDETAEESNDSESD